MFCQKVVESTTTRKAGRWDFTAVSGKKQGREVPQSLRVWKTQSRKNPVRGGCLTGFVGGGNEGKEETSFHLLFNYATIVPFEYI